MEDNDLDKCSDGHGTHGEKFVAGPGERVEMSLDAADTSVRATLAGTRVRGLLRRATIGTKAVAQAFLPGLGSRARKTNTGKNACATVFVAIHIVGIALWVFPVNASLTRIVRKGIGPYFSLVGLQQEWSLFAPDPITANSYVDGEVVLENGEVRTWSFPRLESMDFKERYGKARYRKFGGWLYRRNYAYAWADAARYAARQFRGADSPPRTVKLIRHWERMPSMSTGGRAAAVQTWHSIVFFVYQIPPDETK